MRAAVLRAPQEVVLEDVAVPEPGPGQVLVRLRGAGICASELPVWEGREWFQYPRGAGEPGHEGWGVVETVGDEVENIAAGQRVAVISERAHAELDVVEATSAVVLPAGVPEDAAFPGEPLACAVNAVRRAGVEAGDRVAVVGCGFQGLLLTQLFRGVAGEIVAISRRRSSLEQALANGASNAYTLDDPALDQLEPFDVVVEATGHQAPLDLAARLTRIRGRLVIVGYHQDGLRTVDMQLWNWRGLDVINAHERDPSAYVDGLREAVQAVLAGRLDPRPLLTHRFALEELGDAYRVSAQRPEGFVKAVWCDG